MAPSKNSPASRKKFVSPSLNKRSSPVFWNRRASPNSNKRSSSATQAIRPTSSTTTKAKQTRWNKDMDMTMINILIEEEGFGRKSKNGFGQPVYQRVCDTINQNLKMDISVDNVRNRYRTLKDLYREAHKLEKCNSGFGWDSSTERMSADALTWVELLQTHPEYEKFRYKKVPYFEDLAIIVGDDEANGEDVATGIEADNDMEPIEEIGTNLLV
ncbi:hypothetical protein ACHQM5_014694 [Ranunculus cassubicifolius]